MIVSASALVFLLLLAFLFYRLTTRLSERTSKDVFLFLQKLDLEALYGAFHPEAGDVPDVGGDIGTLVLVGFTGTTNWQHFKHSPEASDGAPDPLDRWSQRVITALAEELHAKALFPFQGPPWLPFLKWAQKAESVHPSPLGMLIQGK